MNATIRPFSLLFLILGALTLYSCEKEEPATEIQKLNTARAKWNASNISSYSFKTTASCFCADINTYEITVTNKAITAVKNAQGQEVQFTGKSFKTIDDFFRYIETALSNNPYKAVIEYDPTYGFPTEIYFDFNQGMVDEEMGYHNKDFQKK